jgi:hypothetical protein
VRLSAAQLPGATFKDCRVCERLILVDGAFVDRVTSGELIGTHGFGSAAAVPAHVVTYLASCGKTEKSGVCVPRFHGLHGSAGSMTDVTLELDLHLPQ